MDDAELLSAVPLLKGLPPDVLARVAHEATTDRVMAGVAVMRQGEPGDAVHIVRSGRLDVEVDGVVVRTATAGGVVGELSLLRAGIRAATVRAVRDSELLTLSGAAFSGLLASEPGFVRALVEELSRRIVLGGVAAAAPSRRGGVLAVVPGHDDLGVDRLRAVSTGLASELSRWDRTAVLRGDDLAPEGWGHALDAAERDNAWTVLEAHGSGEWAAFACRQADRLLAVVDPAHPLAPRPEARSLELLLLGPGPGAATWLEAWAPRTHHLLAAVGQAELAMLARRVSGRAVGVVLSGGGARGLAHVGVLDALRAAGVQVDRVGGTSMGALVSGLHATGVGTPDMVAALERELVRHNPFRDFTWPRESLIRGGQARAMLDRLFGIAAIEEQRIPMFCLSVDLVGAEEVVHRRGSLARAVGMSMSLPGVAPPLRDGERLHVDGGVLNNLPVDVMLAEDEGPVVAVDVMRPYAGPAGTQRQNARRGPGILDTIGRSMVLGSWRKAETGRQLASLVVSPALDDVGMFDFASMRRVVEEGRRATEQVLDAAGGLDAIG